MKTRAGERRTPAGPAAADAALGRGIEAFNEGRYHDALDEFEVPYHAAVGGDRDVYLGLVRASAAMFHYAAGRHVSARKLFATGREVLERHHPAAAGIAIAALLAELTEAFAPLLACTDDEQAARIRPATRPAIQRIA